MPAKRRRITSSRMSPTTDAIFNAKNNEGFRAGRWGGAVATHTTQTHTTLTLTCSAAGRTAIGVFGNENDSHITAASFAGEVVTWNALATGDDATVLHARYDYFRCTGTEIDFHYLGTIDNCQGEVQTAHCTPRVVAAGGGTTDLSNMDKMQNFKKMRNNLMEWQMMLPPIDRTWLNFTETIDNSAAYPRTDRTMSRDRWLQGILYWNACGDGTKISVDIYRNWEGIISEDKVLDGLRSEIPEEIGSSAKQVQKEIQRNVPKEYITPKKRDVSGSFSWSPFGWDVKGQYHEH